MSAIQKVLGSVLAVALGVVAFAPLAHAATGTSTIGGTLFGDTNRNGVQDAGEAGFGSEGLILLNASGAAVSTTATDSNGNFQFTGLSDGTYTVELDHSSWFGLRDTWVPDNNGGGLMMAWNVNLSGSATMGLAVRQIVRSTTTTPISTVTSAKGTVFNSYDDVVTATMLASALASGTLIGAEAPLTTVNFDSYWNKSDQTVMQVGGTPGNYSGYSATVYVAYDAWLDHQDYALFYEYGHAWSLYYAYIVQQDSTLTSYLKERGVYGDSRLGSTLAWEPVEMIADDYRELFGSATAQLVPQGNTDIPLASQVAGLQTFLSTTFMVSPAAPAAPSNLSATAGNAQVSLSWSASSGAASYSVLRCTGTGCAPATLVGSPSSTSFVDSSAVNGTTYTYAVKAVDGAGSSPASNTVSATPQAPLAITGVAMSPNPVVKSGTASFTVSAPATVTVQILNSSGTVVKVLLSSASEASGSVSVNWNRSTASGKKAPSGTYTLLVSATSSSGGTFSQTSPVSASATFSCS